MWGWQLFSRGCEGEQWRAMVREDVGMCVCVFMSKTHATGGAEPRITSEKAWNQLYLLFQIIQQITICRNNWCSVDKAVQFLSEWAFKGARLYWECLFPIFVTVVFCKIIQKLSSLTKPMTESMAILQQELGSGEPLAAVFNCTVAKISRVGIALYLMLQLSFTICKMGNSSGLIWEWNMYSELLS